MRVEFDVDLGAIPLPTRTSAEPCRAERLARQLALAHHFQHLLDSGQVESLAAIAGMCGVSRARISQMMGLLVLSPGIQQEVLKGPVSIDARALWRARQVSDWNQQLSMLL